MKVTGGVMGSAEEPVGGSVSGRLVQLGRAVAEQDCILITGGCPGLPQAAVEGAKAVGGLIVGISTRLSLWEHLHEYGSPAVSSGVGEAEATDLTIGRHRPMNDKVRGCGY